MLGADENPMNEWACPYCRTLCMWAKEEHPPLLTPSPHMQTPSSKRAEQARVLEERGRRPSTKLIEVTANTVDLLSRLQTSVKTAPACIQGSVLETNVGGRATKVLTGPLVAELHRISGQFGVGKLHAPEAIWNVAENPPAPQYLHSDGAASSVIVPVSKSGRNLDVLAVHHGSFMRIRIFVPFRSALVFNASVFHAGSPGTAGRADPSIFFYVGAAADDTCFLRRTLHQFESRNARTFMPAGVVRTNGTLDMEIVKKNTLPLVHFKREMVGWYPGCNEWGTGAPSTYEFRECSYAEFLEPANNGASGSGR